MRNTLLIGAALAFVASGAMAQTPPAKDGPQNSAVNSQNSTNRMVDAPVKGANSFTEGEAKSRIEKMGFANVSDLKKDDHGRLARPRDEERPADRCQRSTTRATSSRAARQHRAGQ